MKELFRLYARKINVGYGVLGKEIVFLSNATLIDINEERTVYEYFGELINAMVITVIDQNNVIGAESFN